MEGAKILNIPLVVTEQYPKGLGSTVKELQDIWGDNKSVFPKTQFTMMIPEVRDCIKSFGSGEEAVKHVVLFGIEVRELDNARLCIQNIYSIICCVCSGDMYGHVRHSFKILLFPYAIFS